MNSEKKVLDNCLVLCQNLTTCIFTTCVDATCIILEKANDKSRTCMLSVQIKDVL